MLFRSCGFKFATPLKGGTIDLGIVVDGTVYWLVSITPVAKRKVITGKNHWLFLDNDSNRSLDQFTGSLALTDEALELWSKYLGLVGTLARAHNTKNWALLLAPAKEELFPDAYPYPRGKKTALDQLLGATANFPVIFPLEELRRDREFTYSKVDTHWSDYGALIAAKAVLRNFQLDQYVDSLPSEFNVRHATGDLGSKESPKVSSATLFAASCPTGSRRIFDNGVPNHGRIWIYQQQQAPIADTLVIFGDSFSINLAPLLASLFARVVYAHSTALWDDWIVQCERPAYVLLQTNQRFIIQAPAGSDIWSKAAKKLNILADPDRQKTLARIDLYDESICGPYVEKLREIITLQPPQ